LNGGYVRAAGKFLKRASLQLAPPFAASGVCDSEEAKAGKERLLQASEKKQAP
jgi:hypothetical protein